MSSRGWVGAVSTAVLLACGCGAAPDGATARIAFVRAPARRPALRIGTLFFNTGGPGAPSKAALGELHAQLRLLAPELTDHFDVIGFDPRGIGESTPAIDCISGADFDRARVEVDFTPDDATASAALDAFARSTPRSRFCSIRAARPGAPTALRGRTGPRAACSAC
jgi:pimeloyl-ACP methyl ester carboxylesterase